MNDFYESSDKTLIDLLLDEQKTIDTPVGRFADKANREAAFGRGRTYESLVPLTAPKPGSQYGFQVDLDRCSGCKGWHLRHAADGIQNLNYAALRVRLRSSSYAETRAKALR